MQDKLRHSFEYPRLSAALKPIMEVADLVKGLDCRRQIASRRSDGSVDHQALNGSAVPTEGSEVAEDCKTRRRRWLRLAIGGYLLKLKMLRCGTDRLAQMRASNTCMRPDPIFRWLASSWVLFS